MNDVITHQMVNDFILDLPDAQIDFPFGSRVAVYDVKGNMFAVVAEKSDPVRLSLRCDPLLAENLRLKYESVMAGEHLNKKNWNTIVLTGQLTWPEIKDLINHSYNLVINE
jgi:predicted DNA-binding protein (MmcQ/YjbR family)